MTGKDGVSGKEMPLTHPFPSSLFLRSLCSRELEMTRDKEKRRNGLALHHVCSPIDKLLRAKAAGKWVSDEEREGRVCECRKD